MPARHLIQRYCSRAATCTSVTVMQEIATATRRPSRSAFAFLSAGTHQNTPRPSRWKHTVKGSPTLIGLTTQNAGSGKITCEIDSPSGKVLKKKSSTGAYAVVSCNVTSFD